MQMYIANFCFHFTIGQTPAQVRLMPEQFLFQKTSLRRRSRQPAIRAGQSAQTCVRCRSCRCYQNTSRHAATSLVICYHKSMTFQTPICTMWSVFCPRNLPCWHRAMLSFARTVLCRRVNTPLAWQCAVSAWAAPAKGCGA